MLSTRRENGRRKKNDASVMSTLDGFVVGLRLLCPLVPVSGQIISSRAESAVFFLQQ